MVRQVDGRGPIGGGGVINPQLVLLGERVTDGNLEIAGVTLVAIGAAVAELDGRPSPESRRAGPPRRRIESPRAAVEVVAIAVEGELVGLAVQGEFSLAGAEGRPADDAAKIWVRLLVLFQIIETEYHVAQLALAITASKARSRWLRS